MVDETTQLGAHLNAVVLVRASDAAEALAQPSFNTDGFSFSRPRWGFRFPFRDLRETPTTLNRPAIARAIFAYGVRESERVC